MKNIITPTMINIRLSKNKCFEYQLEVFPQIFDLFEFSINWRTRGDHAGPTFRFGIRRLFWLSLSVYDRRHWDYNRGTFRESR